jgi:hypothetical protein
MATIIKRRNGFQLRISHKLLPKDSWATFDTREAAEQYGKQLEGLLAQGIAPAAHLERGQRRQEIWSAELGVSGIVCRGPSQNAALSDMTSTPVLLRMSRDDVTIHGSRSLFRDWCAKSVRDSFSRFYNQRVGLT